MLNTFSFIKNWLEARLKFLEWYVMAIAIVASFWAGTHWEKGEASIQTVTQFHTEIKVLHDVKTIHDRVNAMPASDISVGLQKWYRN